MNHYELHTKTLSFFETQVQLMTPARDVDRVSVVCHINPQGSKKTTNTNTIKSDNAHRRI